MPKHEFAVYIKNLNFVGNNFKISDEQAYHRLVRVLRVSENDQIVLFNKEFNILTTILEITKKEIIFELLHKQRNKNNGPKITVLLSVLKQDSFEEAIYFCCELGADIIQPVFTDKVHQKKLDIKHYERLQKIIISAAEQSKNFCFPELNTAKSLDQVLNGLPNNSLKVLFDASGNKFNNQITQSNNIYLMFGPEGDLTEQEKEKLKSAEFYFCALTSTILRSQTAVAVGLGMFRST